MYHSFPTLREGETLVTLVTPRSIRRAYWLILTPYVQEEPLDIRTHEGNRALSKLLEYLSENPELCLPTGEEVLLLASNRALKGNYMNLYNDRSVKPLEGYFLLKDTYLERTGLPRKNYIMHTEERSLSTAVRFFSKYRQHETSFPFSAVLIRQVPLYKEDLVYDISNS